MLIYDKISLNSAWAKKLSRCAIFEENVKTRISYKYIHFLIPGHLRDNCKKYGKTRQAVNYLTKYVAKGKKKAICMSDNYGKNTNLQL
jgi:hypothetical protein